MPSWFIILFALSAAFKISLQSYCCPEPYMGSDLHPYTMAIAENNFAHEMRSGYLTLMWTRTRIAHNKADPSPFNLLVPCSRRTGLTASSGKSPIAPPRATVTCDQPISAVITPLPTAVASSSAMLSPVVPQQQEQDRRQSPAVAPVSGAISFAVPQQRKRSRRRSPAVVPVSLAVAPVSRVTSPVITRLLY